MSVHVNWYNEPPRINNFVFEQSVPEKFLQAMLLTSSNSVKIRKGFSYYNISNTFPLILFCITPNRRIFCCTLFIENILEQVFHVFKLHDIQDFEL